MQLGCGRRDSSFVADQTYRQTGSVQFVRCAEFACIATRAWFADVSDGRIIPALMPTREPAEKTLADHAERAGRVRRLLTSSVNVFLAVARPRFVEEHALLLPQMYEVVFNSAVIVITGGGGAFIAMVLSIEAYTQFRSIVQ